MQQLVIMVHVALCLALIALVLLQQGKGANMGPAFGSGASNTLFGSRGPASFLMKLTGGIAALFFITSLALSFFISSAVHHSDDLSLAPATTNTNINLTPSSSVNSKTDLAPVSIPVSASVSASVSAPISPISSSQSPQTPVQKK
jgi:preprotein translocase subunit SecG